MSRTENHMAGSDYRLCDVCGRKVFYDSGLNYETTNVTTDKVAKVAGESQGAWGYKLESLGDWAVICRNCAKTYKTAIIPIN